MPFDSRIVLPGPDRVIRDDSLRREFGANQITRSPADRVSVRAMMMPRVAVIDMKTGNMVCAVGGGLLRGAYPRGLCIVISGAMTYRRNGAVVAAAAGQVLVQESPDGAERPGTFTFSDDFHAIWVLSADTTMKTTEAGTEPSVFMSPLGASFVAFLATLVARASKGPEQQSPSTTSTAEQIVAFMFESLAFHGQATAAFDGSRVEASRLAEALGAIARTAHLPTTNPTSIADQISSSLSQLHRVFEAHERTVSAEIRYQRTRLALEALHDPRLRGVSLDTIAQSAGFSSTRSLRRAVIEATGLTCMEMRRRALQAS